jgi:TetR/AcrR family transcriptional regulator, transcriptional repressor of aconitase
MPKISEVKKDARRTQILGAAMRLFARQGFQATTMPQICAEAGLSVGAVYGYFDGKEAIIAALVAAGRRGTADLAAEARQKGLADASLEMLLRELQRPGREVLNQVDVRWLAEAIGDPGLRDGYQSAYAILIEQLTGLLDHGAMQHGSPPEAVAELVAAIVVGLQVRRAIIPSADVRPPIDALLRLLDSKDPSSS